ncbi:lectin BRA-3-like isoform X2 [Crassostrea virginica]
MKGPCRENDCLKGERCDVLTTSNSAVCLKTGCQHKQYSFDSSTRTCYRPVVAQLLSWANAEAFCRSDGGHLISLDTNARNSFIAQVLQNYIYPRFWIGLNDIEEEGQFVWVNTGSLHSLDNFTSWNVNQPNNIDFNSILTADCCVTKHDGLWWDDNCENLNPFICEITL